MKIDLNRTETTASNDTRVDDLIAYFKTVKKKYGNIRLSGSIDGGYSAGNPDTLFVDADGDDGAGVVVIGFA